MRLKKTILQRVKHEVMCECGGLMICMSEIKSWGENGPPTQYLHRCVDCGEEQNLHNSYPLIRNEEVIL